MTLDKVTLQTIQLSISNIFPNQIPLQEKLFELTNQWEKSRLYVVAKGKGEYLGAEYMYGAIVQSDFYQRQTSIGATPKQQNPFPEVPASKFHSGHPDNHQRKMEKLLGKEVAFDIGLTPDLQKYIGTTLARHAGALNISSVELEMPGYSAHAVIIGQPIASCVEFH